MLKIKLHEQYILNPIVAV